MIAFNEKNLGQGRESKRSAPPAFTLIELLVVIAVIALLAAMLLPVLSNAKAKAQKINCLSNMHQWGLAFRMYTDDNREAVPDEGDVSQPILSPGTPTATDNLHYAWYNLVATYASQPTLVSLYQSGNPPLPNSRSIFSCPSAPVPNSTYSSPLNMNHAYFMYGENARLCINFSTRMATGIAQTKLSNLRRSSDTVFLAEVDGNSPTTGPSESVVTGFYAMARHSKAGNFAMCDGSSRSAKTNDFWRTQGEANDAGTEWSKERAIYWYPTPTTPN